MTKDIKSTQIRTDLEIYDKVKYIAKKQDRSWNAQATWILRQFVQDYEKVNGKITAKDLEEI